MIMQAIHGQAVVAQSAKLGAGVQVGAYAVIGENVELGEGCILHAHAVIQGPSRFGKNNVFHPFCSVGADPQDLKFHGERTELIAGDDNVFRENVTVSRGTVVLTPPIRPDIRLPWCTRPGVRRQPIEPP